jgi:hypothetical protein
MPLEEIEGNGGRGDEDQEEASGLNEALQVAFLRKGLEGPLISENRSFAFAWLFL